jgi:hypothetical protein
MRHETSIIKQQFYTSQLYTVDTMASPGAPKENANPRIRAVDQDRSRAKREPLKWSQLGDYELINETDEWLPITSEDRAVLHALVDASNATNGKGVSLLRNVGLVIPKSTKRALKQPHFHVAEPAATSEPSSKTANPIIVRDNLDHDEVFDIIRNIQDPEHPHSLEQLGVVSLEQVEVNDASPGSAPFQQSTVNVRFT